MLTSRQPLPPTYDVQLAGIPGFRACIEYSMTTVVNNRTKVFGIGISNKSVYQNNVSIPCINIMHQESPLLSFIIHVPAHRALYLFRFPDQTILACPKHQNGGSLRANYLRRALSLSKSRSRCQSLLSSSRHLFVMFVC